ncbi:MAG: MBL fold metallo-hydrolase [Ktedonobacterales bacterium]
MELLPGIHRVDGVMCNVYVIVEREGLTLIDTGMSGSERKIGAYVRGIGRELGEVRRIVLTHQHVDHVGGAAALAEQTVAEVIASVGDAPAIEGKAQRDLPREPLGTVFRLVLMRGLRPVAVTRTLRAGETIGALLEDGGLQVIEAPGHTLGEIALYVPGRRLLFPGDAYRHKRADVALPPGVFTTNVALARESMRALSELDIEASLPGHGEPIVRRAGEKLRRAVG